MGDRTAVQSSMAVRHGPRPAKRSELTPKMEAAITELVAPRSVSDVARILGISTRTLQRWMKLPAFDGAYREARRLAYDQSIGRLRQAAGPAASIILRVMTDPNAPASVRLKAAEAVLEYARAEWTDVEGAEMPPTINVIFEHDDPNNL